ncbi:MAG TPA: hypothetical protein VHY84_16490 [Bryobacteraceae bacterium]|jgi:hypothetical protein|nr:hypothetical protein [Bryobacteraceae bacterium]
MPSENGRPRTSVDELSRSLRSEMTPLNNKVSYFLALPVAEEDLRQYLHDPVEALPPAVSELLPQLGIVLVPFLERGTTKTNISVVYEKPAEPKLAFSARIEVDGFATLFFTIKDEQVSDYHYYLYDELAALIADHWPEKAEEAWHRLLREELSAELHGEVDEKSWHLKQVLLRRPMAARKDGKPFRAYARQSFEDTMTLYLHGLCCDIDVETGPRQLPSRHLRKRLEALKTLFPPPEGHAVFPEDTNHQHRH